MDIKARTPLFAPYNRCHDNCPYTGVTEPQSSGFRVMRCIGDAESSPSPQLPQIVRPDVSGGPSHGKRHKSSARPGWTGLQGVLIQQLKEARAIRTEVLR